MNSLSIFEFDKIISEPVRDGNKAGIYAVPPSVFEWLKSQALRIADESTVSWIRLSQAKGMEAVKVSNFVGVLGAPNGFQIEVLPKIGRKNIDGGVARQILIDMLCSLQEFCHVQEVDRAKLLARRMPLIEVFIAEFLRATDRVIKRGIHSDYVARQDNLFSLRGKLMMAQHLRQNLFRADRFFTKFDEFTIDRPENRLLHTALQSVLQLTSSPATQKLAGELGLVFANIPLSNQPDSDFQRVCTDRSMAHYEEALAWARLILSNDSPMPLSKYKGHAMPSLLFPMEELFEAFVAKCLKRQIKSDFTLKTQPSSAHLVSHREKKWFMMKPDLLISDKSTHRMVMDTKWKLLDEEKHIDKYGLLQSDFYQLFSYGQSYLDNKGILVLVYPKTDSFRQALPVFEFRKSKELSLWVLPFCLLQKRLLLPTCGSLNEYLMS